MAIYSFIHSFTAIKYSSSHPLQYFRMALRYRFQHCTLFPSTHIQKKPSRGDDSVEKTFEIFVALNMRSCWVTLAPNGETLSLDAQHRSPPTALYSTTESLVAFHWSQSNDDQAHLDVEMLKNSVEHRISMGLDRHIVLTNDQIRMLRSEISHAIRRAKQVTVRGLIRLVLKVDINVVLKMARTVRMVMVRPIFLHWGMTVPNHGTFPSYASVATATATEKLVYSSWADGDDEDHRECSICLVDYEVGERVASLPCKHKFHSACVEKWLGINRKCPLCRCQL